MAVARRATEVRRAELIDAALHVIATHGIAALTTRSLADQVGLTTGAIFRHFASLEALLDGVVARVEAVLDATYPPGDLPPRERLERFLAARSAAVGAQAGILRLVISEQFTLALPEAARARLAACMQRSREFIVGRVREAQAAGTIRADVDADGLAVVIMGTTQMLARATAAGRARPGEAQLVRDTLGALLAPPARPRRPTRRRET
jgi:AcrR family transcriptional regulator